MERVKQRALRALGVLKAFTVTINDIELRVGNYGSVGGAIGSVAGAIGGMLLAAAICAALGIATFGIGLIACALIIALGAAVGAAVGGLAGAAIGGGIGWIADQFSDFDRKGKSVQNGCQMFMTGRWVTDLSHQHNEIHDLDSAVLIDCGVSSSGQGLTLAGAVGTGRHPSGVDP